MNTGPVRPPEPRAASTSANGACLCGAVTFTIAPPYRWFAHCHCSMCRKHGGTLFGSGLGVARDSLDWRSGERHIVHYRASPAFERPFCRECGSTLPAVSHDECFWHVPAGLLTSDPGARPRSHIFVASRSPLYEPNDSLPRHAAYPPGIELPVVETSAPPSPSGTSGSCLCGTVAFAAAAPPRRLIHCHCSLCRRRSAGAFTSTLPVRATEFAWLRGAARVRRYELPAPRSYAADFCMDCGSAVPSVVDARAHTLLPAGSVDSALAPLPAVHLYVGSRAPWFTITDQAPQFAELPPAERLKELLA